MAASKLFEAQQDKREQAGSKKRVTQSQLQAVNSALVRYAEV